MKSSKTIELLSTIFARFGIPKQLVSDNATNFTSEEFALFCKSNGIEHLRSSPYNPMSNGQAERFVDTFKRAIKKMEKDDIITENLLVFLHTYRTTPNTNCPNFKSPAEIFLGRKPRTIFDSLSPLIKQELGEVTTWSRLKDTSEFEGS